MCCLGCVCVCVCAYMCIYSMSVCVCMYCMYTNVLAFILCVYTSEAVHTCIHLYSENWLIQSCLTRMIFANQLYIQSTISVLEIMVSIQTLSDHFGVLSDPKMFGSDIWLSTTSCSFHTHMYSDVIKSFVLRMSTYAFTIC